MPYYGAKQARALFAKYNPQKAKKIIHQLKTHGEKKKAKKKSRGS